MAGRTMLRPDVDFFLQQLQGMHAIGLLRHRSRHLTRWCGHCVKNRSYQSAMSNRATGPGGTRIKGEHGAPARCSSRPWTPIQQASFKSRHRLETDLVIQYIKRTSMGELKSLLRSRCRLVALRARLSSSWPSAQSWPKVTAMVVEKRCPTWKAPDS